MIQEMKRIATLLAFVITFTNVFSAMVFAADEFMVPEVVMDEAVGAEELPETTEQEDQVYEGIVADEESDIETFGLVTAKRAEEELTENDTVDDSAEEMAPPLIPIGDETWTDAESEAEEIEEAGLSILSDERMAVLSSTGAGTTTTKVKKFYNQPELYVADGYDSIEFFVTDGTSYTGKAYLVISKNSSSQNWLLYNYKEETAKAYFTKTEMFGEMYVPSAKADIRQDNAATVSIDEAKIPVMTEQAYNGMYCNWRNFSDIPFSKAADGSIVYATYEVEETTNPGGGSSNPGDGGNTNPGGGNTNPGDGGNTNPGGGNTNPGDGGNTNPGGSNPPQDPSSNNPGGNTDPGTNPGNGNTNPGTPSQNSWSASYYRYTVSLNSGNTYRIFITKSVSYNGKKHVLSTAKSGKKKVNDVKIYVYLNGQLVDAKLYTVKFKNNQNVNGYKGEKAVPYAIINFKFKNKALKADKKAFKKKAFGFNINPMNLKNGRVTFTYKKSGAIKKGTFTASDGSTMKMTTKDFALSSDGNGRTVVTGKGNFTGSVLIDSATPYNNGGTTGGGIY